MPTAMFRTWPWRKVSADGGSNDLLRVRAGKCTERFQFFTKMVSEINKNEHAGALRPRVPYKTRFLKIFYTRRGEK